MERRHSGSRANQWRKNESRRHRLSQKKALTKNKSLFDAVHLIIIAAATAADK
jgi:hypothetical protein